MLLTKENQEGAFLIRKSEGGNHGYSMSVRVSYGLTCFTGCLKTNNLYIYNKFICGNKYMKHGEYVIQDL